MNRSAGSNILRNTFIFSWRYALIAIAFVAFLPGQVFAQGFDACNASLEVEAQGQTPFFVDEEIPILITMGAGSIPGGSLLDVNKVTYQMDCDPNGPGFPNCNWGGNTVVFQGVTGTDCVDSNGQQITFNVVPQNGWTVDFVPQSGLPIRNLANNTCNIGFSVMVTDVASSEITNVIRELTGWVAQDGVCDNDQTVGKSVGLDLLISTARTVFTVTKDFSDDNPAPVDVFISCNDGLPLKSNATITDPTANNGFHYVDFIVKSYQPGRLNCEIWEEPVPNGYSAKYVASDDNGNGFADVIGNDKNRCFYEGVEAGTFTCEVRNRLDDTTVMVNKEWLGDIVDADVSLTASARWKCFRVRNKPAGPLMSMSGSMSFQGAKDSNYITDIYPDFAGNSYCTVTEAHMGSEVETDSSECDQVPVLVGADPVPSCTIYNTVFFEGIPTLSQYGLALLALLMLGLGMAGFRKFA